MAEFPVGPPSNSVPPDESKIMYCAFPTRLRNLRQQVKEHARKMGYAPVIPFDCGDYEDFEGNPRVGRKRTLRFMISVMRGCDVVGVFGISEGVMGEVENALDNDMEVHAVHGLDPEWEKYYEQLKGKYGDLLQRLRGEHTLFSLVGPRAIGKTFWSNRLLSHFGEQLQRVKNTTTRPVRDNADHESYKFVSVEEFRTGIESYRFLEHDRYQGNYYGSSLEEIRTVLKCHSGIFAITPPGAQALYAHRFEINLTSILMVPASEEVLLKNFDRRGITDQEVRRNLLQDARAFTLPPEMEHRVVTITGDAERDEQALVGIIEPLLH